MSDKQPPRVIFASTKRRKRRKPVRNTDLILLFLLAAFAVCAFAITALWLLDAP